MVLYVCRLVQMCYAHGMNRQWKVWSQPSSKTYNSTLLRQRPTLTLTAREGQNLRRWPAMSSRPSSWDCWQRQKPCHLHWAYSSKWAPIFCCFSKLWYLQHDCVGDTIIYHLASESCCYGVVITLRQQIQMTDWDIFADNIFLQWQYLILMKIYFDWNISEFG